MRNIILGYKLGVTNFSYPLHLVVDNFFLGRCLVSCCHLDEPPKKHPPILWGSSVKSKGEFIQVILKMVFANWTLQRSENPSFKETDSSMAQGKWGVLRQIAFFAEWGCLFDGFLLMGNMRIACYLNSVVTWPSVTVNCRSGLNQCLDFLGKRFAWHIWDAFEPNAAKDCPACLLRKFSLCGHQNNWFSVRSSTAFPLADSAHVASSTSTSPESLSWSLRTIARRNLWRHSQAVGYDNSSDLWTLRALYPFFWRQMCHIILNQVRSGVWVPWKIVPERTEWTLRHLGHFSLYRSDIQASAFAWQKWQTNPSGQRIRNRYFTQSSSVTNCTWNSFDVLG